MEVNNRARWRLYHLARHVGPILEDQPRAASRSISAQVTVNSWLSLIQCCCASSFAERELVRVSVSVGTQACSAGGRDGFQRRDNRTLFARQSTDNHGQFMRPAALKQDGGGGAAQVDAGLSSASPLGPDGICKRWKPSAGRQLGKEVSDAPGPSFAAIEPLFARPTLEKGLIGKLVAEARAQNPEPEIQASNQDLEPSTSGGTRDSDQTKSVQPPAPVAKTQEESSSTAKEYPTLIDSSGFEWFPRMDVVESGTAYVITVELSGVSADGIHVEVVNGSLIVTGSRATDWWKANNDGNGTVYHRRELAQGPYRACWRLPKNGYINGITAEFIDGFLRVLVPKIKVTTYL